MTTPEITLDPMTAAEFDAWLEPTIREYAEEKVETGEFPAENAIELSAAEFHSLLPDGMRTKDHHLYTVRAVADGTSAGVLWIALRPKADEIEAFVYDIAIHENRRGQGYGRAAMLACAERARELGAHSVGLHVFGRNTVARSHYTSLGFQELDVTMSLPLGTEGDRAD